MTESLVDQMTDWARPETKVTRTGPVTRLDGDCEGEPDDPS
jgi:hypothetical protein